MSWKGFNIKGTYYDLTHLQKSTVQMTVDGKNVKVHISYGHHCFTDEKENGPMLFKKDGRYWCNERYECSKNLPAIIGTKLLENYAIPYISRKQENYHYMEAFDYAIFFHISKPENTTNELNLRIHSAYEVDQWGRETMPKGSPKRISWIMSERLQGRSVL